MELKAQYVPSKPSNAEPTSVNPFNGIESFLGMPKHHLEYYNSESIQWNWKWSSAYRPRRWSKEVLRIHSMELKDGVTP